MKSVLKLLYSFGYALNGIFFCIRTCRNFRIHTVAAAVVIYFSGFYELTSSETALMYLTVGGVIALECVNTALEQMCNAITTQYSSSVKRAKDTAAGAVLCMAVAAIAVAFWLFWDVSVFSDIAAYFSAPIRLAVLICFVILAILYIFYEDIFKHGKK